MKTDSVWPSKTATLWQDAVRPNWAGLTSNPSRVPSKWSVSLSIFSSSPPIKGTRLSTIAIEGTPL